MNCADVKVQFDAYLEGHADDASRRAVEEHLAVCPDCYELLLSSDDELDSLLRSDWYNEAPSAGFLHGVMMRVEKQGVPASVLWLLPIWLVYAAVVAGLSLWMVVGNSILGVSMADLMSFIRSFRAVVESLAQALRFLNINEGAVFMVFALSVASLAVIGHLGKEVLSWIRE